MPVTKHPLHGCVRAEPPHTALALGRDDQTLVRVGWQLRMGGNQWATNLCIRFRNLLVAGSLARRRLPLVGLSTMNLPFLVWPQQ